MKTKLIALAAAALISTTALTPAAQAGMRVGFGFPLGAIVATQALGSMAQQNRKKQAYQQQQNQQARHERAAAKKRQQQQAAAARAEARAKKQAQASAAQRHKVAKQNAAQQAEEANVAAVSKPDTTSAPSVYIPGPTAPVAAGAATAGALPEPTELKDASPVDVSNKTIEEGQAVADNTATSAPVDAAALSAETEAIADPASAETASVAETGVTKRECRKYFPTVGRLVTVTCED